MKKSFAIIFISTITILAATASARSMRLKLPYYGEQFRGQNTLFLKQKIRSEYPHINLGRAEIEKVILVAKSKRGRGSAHLRVGPNHGMEYTVGRDPYDFNERGYFQRIHMDNYDGSRGAWQIKLRGNIKVKKVVVIINTRNRPSRPMVTRSCTYKLKSLFGRRQLGTFYGQATGVRGSGVEQRACNIARRKCYDFKAGFGDFGNLGTCKQR